MLEDSIISAIPSECPYTTPHGPEYKQKCFEIRQEALREIFRVSTLHFLRVISQKAPETAIPHDMAVANRVLRASIDGSLLDMMLKEPELRKRAGFDEGGLRGLSAAALQRRIESQRVVVRKALNKEVADWMVDMCQRKGWQNVAQDARIASAALAQGRDIPFGPTVFVPNILSKYPKDHDAFLRYERFVDGFSMPYRDEPSYVPRM